MNLGLKLEAKGTLARSADAALTDAEMLDAMPRDAMPGDAVARLRAENDRLASENARLARRMRELERSADSDPLIDIYNRRAFVREIARAQTVSARYHIPSVALYFDLNDFKAVNDRWGHAIGDDLLRAIGEGLASSVRDCDLVARLGGDEFGVLLFKTTLAEARAKADRLLCQIVACRVPRPGFDLSPDPVAGQRASGDVCVRAVWGAAACEPGVGPEAILARADRDMYQAKAAG